MLWDAKEKRRTKRSRFVECVQMCVKLYYTDMHEVI